MYAKTKNGNRMNSQTNETMKNVAEYNKNNDALRMNKNDGHKDFYYRKEHEEYVSKLNILKAFYFNRV